MNLELPEADLRLSKGLINLQDRYSSHIMDGKARKKISTLLVEGKRTECHHAFLQGNTRRLLAMSYFSVESFVLLVCLTASLLILPLILPPLPPPPFLLLLLPIGILAVLMILAFMPSNVRDITYV